MPQILQIYIGVFLFMIIFSVWFVFFAEFRTAFQPFAQHSETGSSIAT